MRAASGSRAFTHKNLFANCLHWDLGLRKNKLRLPSADQLDIHLGQEFRIEQCAVLDAARVIDGIAHAQIIEPIRGAGMLAAGDQQGIDHPLAVDHNAPGPFQFGIQKAKIEHRVMSDQLRVAKKFDEFLDLLGEERLIPQKLDRQPVNFEGRFRHVAFRVEITMEGLAGRKAVKQFDTADLDQSIALKGIEACGFGIENDLAHPVSYASVGLVRRL